MEYTSEDYSARKLKIRQHLSLDIKIGLSLHRIREWHNHFGGRVYVSFSGGKDSTVLLDLVRSEFPEVPAVFCDTGLEYPEIRSFVKTIDNVVWIKPKMSFLEVIRKYGFPVISKEQSQYICEARATKSEKLKKKRLGRGKGSVSLCWRFLLDAPFLISHKCCDIMKKRPFRKYEKDTGRCGYLGVMAADSELRSQAYQKHGCNSFEGRPTSSPLAFWKTGDIWEYINTKKLPYSKIYDKGLKGTGCVFCAYGAQSEEPENRFEIMKQIHFDLWNYCMETLGMRSVLDFIGVRTGDKPKSGFGLPPVKDKAPWKRESALRSPPTPK